MTPLRRGLCLLSLLLLFSGFTFAGEADMAAVRELLNGGCKITAQCGVDEICVDGRCQERVCGRYGYFCVIEQDCCRGFYCLNNRCAN